MMNGIDRSGQARVSSGINGLLGVLLFASAWTWNFEHAFTSLALSSVGSAVVGPLIALCAVVRFWYPRRSAWLSGANIALGASAVVLPWIDGYTTDVEHLWFTVILGIAVIALAAWSGGMTLQERRQRLGHA